ncbi:MAG: type II secretion system protein [Armatimonadota bacterium]
MNAIRAMRDQKGFTLIEIMIVVLIIGILLAIAIPNFVTARTKSQTKSCIANLKQIDTAVQQYAMTPGASDAACTATTLTNATTGFIKTWPKCPTNDLAYADPSSLSATPVCPGPVAGHVLN